MNHFPFKLELADIINNVPQYFIQSNQNLKSLTNSYGGGYMKFNDMTVTSNHSTSSDGIFFYIKDLEIGNSWTSALWPSFVTPQSYSVDFSDRSLKFCRVDQDLETTTEIVVSPRENIEIRKISIKNLSQKSKKLEITSYMDVVILDDNRKDLDHSQFHNLFVQSEFDTELRGLLFKRRSFNAKSTMPGLFHALLGNESGTVTFETNRQNFIGRLGTLEQPAAMRGELTCFEGDVLDPVASMRVGVTVGGLETAVIYSIVIVDSFIDNVKRIAERYRTFEAVQSLFDETLHAENGLIKELNLFPEKILLYQRVGSMMIAGNAHTDFHKSLLPRNTGHVDSLWKHRISGDFPILLVIVDNMYFNELVEDVLNCHEYLIRSGYDFDVVLLNETGNPLATEHIKEKISLLGFESKIDTSKGIFLLDGQSIEPGDTLYLKHFAQLIVNASDFNTVLSND